MIRKRLEIFLGQSITLVLVVSAACGSVSGETVEYTPVFSAEPAFDVPPGARLLLNGDSISKGYAYGNYTNPSPLRTLYGMATILMKENLLHAPQFLWLPGIWEGIDSNGVPKTVDSVAGEIQLYIRHGNIRTGDWMIYEDAGGLDNFIHPAPYPNTNHIYSRYRQSLHDMVLEAQSAIDRDHIRLMTMFSYHPKSSWCDWSAPVDDGHSGNDAIRDEAAALGVKCIDMKRIMDSAEKYVESSGWGRLVGPDGIHPNVYGNFVMVLAILDSLGADVAHWKLDELSPHFHHTGTGGDVGNVWGFKKDPSDMERDALLVKLHGIVTEESQRSRKAQEKTPMVRNGTGTSPFYPTAYTFQKMIRYGRILDHPLTQPEGTSKPASYEIGKLLQLDKDTALLIVSLREQGGHDFEIGNDGFIFRNLSDIRPDRAFPINRLDPHYTTRAGQPSVLSRYCFDGMIIPLGAKLEDGRPHPAAGTGFILCTTLSFKPDRSEVTTDPDQFVELYQVHWDGKTLKLEKDELPEPYAHDLIDLGFRCLLQGENVLCPVSAEQGIEVLLFEHKNGRWLPTTSGGIFSTIKKTAKIKAMSLNGQTKPFAVVLGEMEPSIVEAPGGYIVYTRGPDNDPTGRTYWSPDGLHYYLRSQHWNHTVPQVLSEGLDGSLYLASNVGPGMLRNPLYLFAVSGLSFLDPLILHDEKNVRDTRGKEVPFCDHGVGASIYLNGRWHHFFTYRVLDLRETNGEGAAPFAQTGLYMAELEYENVTHVPFKF